MKQKFNINTEFHELHDKILNFINIIIAIFLLPALFVSILRTFYTGFKWLYVFHFFIIVIIWATFFLREKIKQQKRISIIIISLLAITLPSIPSFGLEGHWGPLAILYSFLATMFFGRKTGILFVVFTLLYFTSFGYIYIVAPTIPNFFSILQSVSFYKLLFHGFIIVVISLSIVFVIDKYRSFFIQNFNNLFLAKEKIKESELKYKQLSNITFEGILIHEKGKVIDLNLSLGKMFGYTRDELIGKNIIKLLVPEKHHPVIYEKIMNDYGLPYEIEGVKKDGSIIPLEVEAKNVETYDNKTIRVTAIRDITLRKETEKKLLKLSTAVEQSANSIVITDTDGNIEYTNPKFTEITGYTAQEVLGQNPRILNSGIQPTEYYTQLWDTVTKGKIWKGEFCNKTKDGNLFWEQVIITPIKDERNKIINFLAIKEDITERFKAKEEKEKLQQQLVQSQKMEAIGTLAGGIAHDFNNILGVIMGYTELTMDNHTNTKKVISNLQRVMKASERAKEMVHHILSFSRKSDQTMRSVNIGNIIKETITFLRSSIPTTIEIKYNIEDLGIIIGNATQINQILMNLCTNATHAMKKDGGVLNIELKEIILDKTSSNLVDLEPGKYQQLSVNDTGTGIGKAIIDRIFEPYFTTKEVGEGTGLGLFVIYGIMKNHKGMINVYSESGIGTTFNVYFPVMDSEKTEELQTEQEITFQGNNEMVLFVDDEIILAELGTKMLKNLGYQVECRTSSIEALEAFKTDSDKFDLIITDMTMPDMTGIKLAREIHKVKSNIPVILCTGFSHSINKDNFKAHGISALIMKPVVKNQLSKTIRDVLEEKKKS